MALIPDWPAALRSPSFWRSYYASRFVGDDKSVTLDVLFPNDPAFDDDALWGDDPEEVTKGIEDDEEEEAAFEAALHSGSRLQLPLPGGVTWEIRFSTAPGIYHELLHGDHDPVTMGYDGPHCALPILRQPELVALDRLGTTDWWRERGPVPGCFLVPLFQPTCWLTDDDDHEAARTLFIGAWLRTGQLDQEAASRVADGLVYRVGIPEWAPCWRHEGPDWGWVSDGRHTQRGPRAPASAAANHLFTAIDEVLRAERD